MRLRIASPRRILSWTTPQEMPPHTPTAPFPLWPHFSSETATGEQGDLLGDITPHTQGISVSTQ